MKKPATPNMILHVTVKPNARTTKLISQDERGMVIALKARPQDGEANKELIAFLSELTGTPKSKISIRRGVSSRIKQVDMPWSEKLEGGNDND